MRMFIPAIFAGLVLFSASAEARYIGPILVKTASTGFVAPEFSKTQSCEIYADRTILTNRFAGSGQLSSVKTQNQTLGGDYTAVLQKAQKASLVSQPGPVDGPSVKYVGVLINPNDSVTNVLLYQENGGSGQIVNNTSPEAVLLKNVIDELCPNTLHGIGPAPLD